MSNEERKDYMIRRRDDENLPPAIPDGKDVDVYVPYHHHQPQESVESEASGGGFSLRDVFYLLFRHKWKILVIFLTVGVGSVLFVVLSQNIYQSEGKVFIRGDRITYSIDPTGENNSFVKGERGASVQTRSEKALLTSTRVAERVVDEIGVNGVLSAAKAPASGEPVKRGKATVVLEAVNGVISRSIDWIFTTLRLTSLPLTPREMAVQSVVNNLTAEESMGGSNVLILTYSSYNPEAAQRILNAIMWAYVEEHIAIHKSQVSGSFFKTKADELKSLLEVKEQALDKRKKELNITSLASQKDLILNELNAMETRLNETGAELSAAEARISAFKKRLTDPNYSSPDGTTPGGMNVSLDPEIIAIRDRIVKLKIEEIDMRSRYTENSSVLANIRSQIKNLEKNLATQKPVTNPVLKVADPMRQGLLLQFDTEQALASGLVAREAKLKESSDKLRRELGALTAHEQEIDQLQREVSITDNQYRQYLNGVQASEISETLDRNNVSSVSILQNATRPSTPVRSQKKTIALMGFGIFMGLVLGLGLAITLEYLNHSIKTEEDLEMNLGLPVLVSLPETKHHKVILREDAV